MKKAILSLALLMGVLTLNAQENTVTKFATVNFNGNNNHIGFGAEVGAVDKYLGYYVGFHYNKFIGDNNEVKNNNELNTLTVSFANLIRLHHSHLDVYLVNELNSHFPATEMYFPFTYGVGFMFKENNLIFKSVYDVGFRGVRVGIGFAF